VGLPTVTAAALLLAPDGAARRDAVAATVLLIWTTPVRLCWDAAVVTAASLLSVLYDSAEVARHRRALDPTVTVGVSHVLVALTAAVAAVLSAGRRVLAAVLRPSIAGRLAVGRRLTVNPFAGPRVAYLCSQLAIGHE